LRALTALKRSGAIDLARFLWWDCSVGNGEAAFADLFQAHLFRRLLWQYASMKRFFKYAQ